MDTDELIRRHVEENPRKPGIDEVWLVGSSVPVWAIVGHYKAIGRNARQVAADYDVPVEAVEAALAYYRRHRAVIDARIKANEPARAAS
ncbi:MAG: DUF433 domain-containing protein [Chloroflexi bacterium]|nr:DUF433 domain-containing protein [Chloroflexota bacterium]